jgi:transcriptional regulator with XRE-family HTH domain
MSGVLESINTKPASDNELMRNLPTDEVKNLAGANIRLLRKKRGWSQQELAKSLRGAGMAITRDIIANIETQRCHVPDTLLVLFASQLDVMAEALLPDRAGLEQFIQALSLKPQPDHPLHTRRKRGST